QQIGFLACESQDVGPEVLDLTQGKGAGKDRNVVEKSVVLSVVLVDRLSGSAFAETQGPVRHICLGGCNFQWKAERRPIQIQCKGPQGGGYIDDQGQVIPQAGSQLRLVFDDLRAYR